MKLRVHEILDAKVYDATGLIPAKEIPLDLPDHPTLVKPVEVEYHAEAFKDEVLVMGKAVATIRIACSRCLEDYEAAIPMDFEIHTPVKFAFVDVSEEIRQSLLLSLPPKPLCRATCKGLCPHCGTNLNQKACRCGFESPENPFSKLKDFRIH